MRKILILLVLCATPALPQTFLNQNCDVRGFGALGDGATDNYAAFAATVAACPAGGVIYIPASDNAYILGTALTISKANVTIRGDGWNSSIKAKANALLDHIIVASNAADGLTLENLKIDGNRANHGTTRANGLDYMLYIRRSHVILQHLEITAGRGFGVVFDDATAIHDVLVENCYIHDIGEIGTVLGPPYDLGGGIRVGFSGSTSPYNFTFRNNTIINMFPVGVANGGDSSAIGMSGTDSVFDGNYIAGIHNISGAAIGAASPGGVYNRPLRARFVNNTIDNTDTGDPMNNCGGIEINGTDFEIIGNNVFASKTGAVIINGDSGYGVIANNVFSLDKTAPNSTGVLLNNASGLKPHHIEIVHNVISATHGITRQPVTSVLVKDNDFTDTTTPMYGGGSWSVLNRWEGNYGYNPVGPSIQYVSGSPYPFFTLYPFADESPATFYFNGGTVSAVEIGKAFVVTAATNASTIVVKTADPNTLASGDKVNIILALGNTAVNGVHYAKVLTTTSFELYSDAGLTTPVAGNGAYTSGGLGAYAFTTVATATPTFVSLEAGRSVTVTYSAPPSVVMDVH